MFVENDVRSKILSILRKISICPKRVSDSSTTHCETQVWTNQSGEIEVVSYFLIITSDVNDRSGNRLKLMLKC